MLKFELSKEMVEVIGRCLQAGPYNQVAPVIVELQQQINAQVNGAKAPKDDKEE